MRRLRMIPVLTACLLLASAPALASDLVLVGNPDSGLSSLERDQVVNIYMGRYRKLPSGITALPLDYTDEREAFYQTLVGRSLPEINSYWARLVFSGRGSPPRQVDSASELLDIVTENRGAIGYLPEDKVDDRVVVLSNLGGSTGKKAL